MHTDLQVLRAKVRGLQAAGVTLQCKIRKSKGDKRAAKRLEKRCLGWYSRMHLIAYGLLRDVPYERIERCSEENKPDPNIVFELMKLHGDYKMKRELTVEKVKLLLVVPPGPKPLQPQRPKRPYVPTQRPTENGTRP